ncbi:MAG TPA: alpha/beta hydrolase-fold protein [Burkholderiaceae bacterium]
MLLCLFSALLATIALPALSAHAAADSPARGTVTIVPDFASPQLANKRALRIYLPPSYAARPDSRYPVLYMHDGQNLFDKATSFIGVEWQVDETMDRLIAAGAIAEVIVVGIDNNADRIQEYTPCCDAKRGGGKIAQYERFIVDTVKPYIDRTLRTLPGREHTAIIGSSLGGIASVHIASNFPAVFGKAGGVSSSFWWNDGSLIKQMQTHTSKVPVQFYLDAGTDNDGVEDTRRMRAAMLEKGYVEGQDLYYYEDQGAGHNERWWAARLDKPLLYMFGRKAAR